MSGGLSVCTANRKMSSMPPMNLQEALALSDRMPATTAPIATPYREFSDQEREVEEREKEKEEEQEEEAEQD